MKKTPVPGRLAPPTANPRRGLLDRLDGCLEAVLLRHRWLFVLLFLLPASVLFNVFEAVRNWLQLKLNSASELHDRKVARIQREVKQARQEGHAVCTGRPSWQTMSFRQGLYKETMRNVRLDLYDILEIDVENMLVRVEPMVTMGQLSRALVPIGLSVPVLPEIDDLTVGGLVMGCGIETSSHKYGLFQHCCQSIDLVLLKDGSMRRCSRTENPELFHAIFWSHGTIGLLVSVSIKLVRVSSLVRLEYRPFDSLGQISRALREAAANTGNDFVEAIMFSVEIGVLITGRMIEQKRAEEAVNPIGRWYKPWFFKHVESMLGSTPRTECVPLRDYYHRHTQSLFWELQNIVPFGNSWPFRYFLGWTMPPKVSLLKLTQTKAVKKLYETAHVIQDLLVPMEKLDDTIVMLDEAVKIYPLWLCPFKLSTEPGFVHARKNASMYVDVGVYGVPKAPNFKAVRTTRRIEKFLLRHSAYQMLYADTYVTREEFRQMFDHSLYDRVRREYDVDGLPEVYDKVNKAART